MFRSAALLSPSPPASSSLFLASTAFDLSRPLPRPPRSVVACNASQRSSSSIPKLEPFSRSRIDRMVKDPPFLKQRENDLTELSVSAEKTGCPPCRSTTSEVSAEHVPTVQIACNSIEPSKISAQPEINIEPIHEGTLQALVDAISMAVGLLKEKEMTTNNLEIVIEGASCFTAQHTWPLILTMLGDESILIWLHRTMRETPIPVPAQAVPEARLQDVDICREDYCTTLEGDDSSSCWRAYFELKDLEKESPKEDMERFVRQAGGLKSLIDCVHGVTAMQQKKDKEAQELISSNAKPQRERPFPVPDGLPKTQEEIDEEETGRMPDSPFTRLLRSKGKRPAWYSQAPDHETD